MLMELVFASAVAAWVLELVEKPLVFGPVAPVAIGVG